MLWQSPVTAGSCQHLSVLGVMPILTTQGAPQGLRVSSGANDYQEGPDCFSLSIMWGKAEENEMRAWFFQEPGMGTLEES